MTQHEALDLLKLGHNAYLTGPAGSGKTFLLNQYIEYLKANQVAVAVTASTGIAATHMNGTTIHSWSGLGIKDKISDQDIQGLLNREYLHRNIKPAKVLIIDEVSMLHAWQLDAVDRICRAFKEVAAPFGGIQVIMSGDFFQLPPVAKNSRSAPFVTASDIWEKMELRICYLEEQHRHIDPVLSGILQKLRRNEAGEGEKKVLLTREYQDVNFGIKPTKLYTHNANVDAFNNIELDKIQEQKYVYKMHCQGPPVLVDMLKKGCLAPEELEIKKGAVVMFIKNNFKRGYVNGTLGIVVDYDSDQRPIVKTVKGYKIVAMPEKWAIEENGIEKASITQIPLRLAWAITVHKSQGMSMDAAEMDLSKSFVGGMGYVALSRVRSLAGIKLMGLNEVALQVNPSVIELDKALLQRSEQDKSGLVALGAREVEKRQKQFVKTNTVDFKIQV